MMRFDSISHQGVRMPFGALIGNTIDRTVTFAPKESGVSISEIAYRRPPDRESVSR
jgi:hypothetical protein